MIEISMRKYSTIVLAVLLNWPPKPCGLTSLSGFQFDVNDILDEKLMPTRLFTQPFSSFLNLRNENFVIRRNRWPNEAGSISDFNFSTALTTMTFHRRMMNEYLATTFLAKQLLAPSKLIWVERRMGKVPMPDETFNSTNSVIHSGTQENNGRNSRHLTNHKMLMDEGSSQYKDWLERSTLDDIRRHFQGEMLSNQSSMHDVTKRHYVRNNRRNDEEFVPNQDNMVDDNEEYEDGDITGYALTNFPETSQSRFISPNHLYLSNDALDRDVQPSGHFAQIVNKNGYEPPYDSYGVHSPHPQSHPHQHSPYRAPSYQTPHPPLISAIASVNGKEISLKDITDIALTTLAFLSFGMFILQVLMCITMGKDDSANMMMLPMEGGEGAADIPDDGIEEIRRRKRRSAPISERFIAMNDLARRVLHSIDAVLLMPKDKGSCHYLSICKHNQFARTQLNGQRLWIPVWSLGLSWFTSRLFTDDTTRYGYDSILKSLKAIVIGSGNGKCKQYYGQGCRS